MPAGMRARMELLAETIWAMARSTFTFGWKKILMTEMPSRVWASIVRMSLTLELMEYSL